MYGCVPAAGEGRLEKIVRCILAAGERVSFDLTCYRQLGYVEKPCGQRHAAENLESTALISSEAVHAGCGSCSVHRGWMSWFLRAAGSHAQGKEGMRLQGDRPLLEKVPQLQ